MENINQLDEFRKTWTTEIRNSQAVDKRSPENGCPNVSSVGPSVSQPKANEQCHCPSQLSLIKPKYESENASGKTRTDDNSTVNKRSADFSTPMKKKCKTRKTEDKNAEEAEAHQVSGENNAPMNKDNFEGPVGHSESDVFNPFSAIGELCGVQIFPPYGKKLKYFSEERDDFNRTSRTCGCSVRGTQSKTEYSIAAICQSGPSLSFNKKGCEPRSSERILDLFIADLDEITDIPFFDITLPKEVAIKIFCHLDVIDLCRCAQVSRSWRAIAEDELLWCNLCHELGYDKEYVTVEKSQWKKLLRDHVEKRRLLIMNWKNRSGRIEQLEHVKGGVLSAVNSCNDFVVAGYTNGDCVLWNIETGSECCFQPSSCALILNENAEEGTLSNYITKLALSNNFTAAAYSQGNIDIWSNSKGVDAVHTFRCTSSVTQICVAESHPLIASAYGSTINIQDLSTESKSGGVSNIGKMVADIKLVPSSSSIYHLAVWADNLIGMCPAKNLSVDMHVVHNMIDSQVVCFDVTENCAQMAVGLGGYSEGSRILMYDVISGRLSSTLKSCGIWRLSCMNLKDSPSNYLATGSTDKKIRLFDTRADSNPVSILSGHSHQICTVQMDDWKVAAGVMDGFICVWDQRMNSKLWELHNRHPVRHCKFNERKLIVGNVPTDFSPNSDDFEATMHRRYRGSIHYYDFEVDQTTQGVPDICSSAFDEPERYNYNIRLQMPYDKILC